MKAKLFWRSHSKIGYDVQNELFFIQTAHCSFFFLKKQGFFKQIPVAGHETLGALRFLFSRGNNRGLKGLWDAVFLAEC